MIYRDFFSAMDFGPFKQDIDELIDEFAQVPCHTSSKYACFVFACVSSHKIFELTYRLSQLRWQI